jgi:hypothetical protein
MKNELPEPQGPNSVWKLEQPFSKRSVGYPKGLASRRAERNRRVLEKAIALPLIVQSNDRYFELYDEKHQRLRELAKSKNTSLTWLIQLPILLSLFMKNNICFIFVFKTTNMKLFFRKFFMQFL